MSQFKTIAQRVAAFVLWLLTIGLGIVDVYFIREIFFAIFARFSTDGRLAGFISQLLVVFTAIVLVGFIVVTSEYHRKHVCERKSWNLFIWTLAVQVAIPLISILVV